MLYTAQAFFLQIQGNKGTLTDTSRAIEYREFDNVDFGLSANRVSLDVDFKDENYLGTVNNEIEGFTAYMALYF